MIAVMSVLYPLALKPATKSVGVLFGFSVSPVLLGVGALALACGVARGGFHPAAVALLFIALTLWIAGLFPNGGRRAGFGTSSIGLLSLIIAMQLAWSALAGTGLRDHLDVSPMTRATPMIAVLVALPLSFRRPMTALVISVVAFAFAVVTTILITPEPFCDVWMFQQGAAQSLVNGTNPYHTLFYSPYEAGTPFYGPGIVDPDGSLTVSFPYPPASLLMVLPGYLLGDVRFALLGWWVIGVVSIALVGWSRSGGITSATSDYSRSCTDSRRAQLRMSVLIALALLSSPHALMLVLTGWTESILIGLVGLAAWCFAKKPNLAWIPLGLLFASKQYLIVLAPVTFLFLNRSTVTKALLVAIAMTLPFLYADCDAFYRSVIEFHFIQPFRTDGLTISAFVGQAFGIQLSWLISLLMVMGIFFLLRRNLLRDASMWFVGAAVTLVAFFAFSKQAFGNYYMLAIALMLAASALWMNRTKELSVSQSEEWWNLNGSITRSSCSAAAMS